MVTLPTKEYEAMLPSFAKIEDLVAKGNVEQTLIDARLKLSGISKEDFAAWKKDPGKFVFKPGPTPFNSTYFEQLMAVGYHPQLRELMGVINIKQPWGYGGTCPTCIGSTEYVRFYVDLANNGDYIGSWEDQGVGLVHVFDPGAANSSKLPLEYAVRKSISLPFGIWNMLENNCAVRRVRAILSWMTVPPSGSPSWIPFWGNVFETNIRFHG